MGPCWALDILVLLLLPSLLGGSTQDPELVLVAPRLVALGTPVGLLVAAVGPVTGTVTAWPGESDRGGTPCALPVRFDLGTHNDFSQILNIEVTPEQARRCGALEAAVEPTLLLEAQSPHLLPQRVRVGLGGPRGVLLLQTDKPLYAPRQTVRFRVFSLDPDLRPNTEPILVTITNPLGARVREGQRVPMGPVLSDQIVLPDIAPVPSPGGQVEAGSPGSPPVRAQMTVTPVAPVSGRFLLLEGPGGPLRPGDLLRLQLRDVGPPPAPHIYHLLAVARGRLVAARGVRRGTVTEVTLPVTPAMAPRLRLVAFFQAEGQLVAASWAVPVVSSCHSQVRVEVGRRGSPLRPQTPLKVTGKVTLPGAPAATLALSATDATLLELEPRHRLRPAQVTPKLRHPKPFCAPPTRSRFPAPGCPPTPPRPRRSSKLLELLETGAPRGNDTVAGRCCRDGGVKLPLQVTCSQRAQRVPEAGGLTVFLPDSITTWEIQAIAVIPGHGLCVAVAQRVTVTQDLYVALQLPPSTRPHEQLQLLPHIHSRLPHGVNVTVTLAVAEGVCAGLDGPPRHLEVPPGGTVALPLTLVALRPGDVPVTVTARGPWGLGDRITRVLHVEPEGELHLEENSYVLDTDGKEGRTLEIPGDIPAGIIPDGEFSVSIRVTGRVGGWAVRGALGTGAMLLRSPRGCGEQALMALAPRAAALRYLDHSGGWRALPPDSRARGLRGLQRGFERVQNFRKSDGSYSAWQHRGGSTWLTALVLRVLALARPYLPLDAGGPGTSLRWLLGQQRPDGAFRENEPVLHREMQGSVADPGPEATVSLTAFVVVALQGARVLLPPDSPDHPLLDEALSRAVTFLRGHVETLGTFGTAITTYALALGDTGPPGPSPTLERLRRLARPAQGGRAQFWPAGGPAATVEATGYGLLALLQLHDGAGAARAARWLREQSNYGGGFRSTQDTLVALEALAQMWLQWGDAAGSGLSLGLSWPGGARGRPGETQLTLGPGLQSLEKELQAPLGSPITVRVEGHGEGTLMVLRQFRLMSPLNGSCQGLGLGVAITGPIIYEEEDYEDDEEEVELEEEAEPVNGTGPEGVEPNEEAGPAKGVEPAEATAPLLPRRREGHDPAKDVAFLVCIWREAGVELSGMAVAEISLLSGFRPHQADLDKVEGRGVGGLPGSLGGHYALLVRVLEQSEAGPFLAFELEILEVLMGEVAAGGRGRLLFRGSCPLRLRPQRRFLLMGGEGSVAGTSQSPQFLLGPHSWLEEAPSRPHCGPAPNCRPLLEFMETLRSRGCPF
ncbi:PREDICTED: complement C4-B-like [Calidris pugnax]|uniref:complement C4-B-like n=1 Tax=Calidris pugnax TaxID=198806 RepID=UPI00071CAF5E|nr:PREDICTED: complement C4-B-like [Calidris pugnax]